jgi:hypothetical protein
MLGLLGLCTESVFDPLRRFLEQDIGPCKRTYASCFQPDQAVEGNKIVGNAIYGISDNSNDT